MKASIRVTVVALAASAVMALSGCAGQASNPGPDASGLDKLPIRFNWTFEAADHPWFFAGMREGIYAKHGIDLQPQEGTGSASTLQLVASGSDPVGLVDAGTMMGGVGKGLPVKSACVLAQRNPMSVIFPAEAGISTIRDLAGKTVAVTPGDSLSQIFPAVLAKNGMSEDEVKMVGLSDPAAKQNSVLTGASDAFLGYYTLQLPAVEQSSGKDMDHLSFSELGVDTLSMAIVTNTSWASQNEDLLGRFIKATQESVDFVVANPAKAADHFVEGVPSFDKELASKQIEAAIPLLHTKATERKPACWTAESDWKQTQEVLAKNTGLPVKPLDLYYTNEHAK